MGAGVWTAGGTNTLEDLLKSEVELTADPAELAAAFQAANA